MLVTVPENPRILLTNKITGSSEIYKGSIGQLHRNDIIKIFESDWKCISPIREINRSISDGCILSEVINETQIDVLFA